MTKHNRVLIMAVGFALVFSGIAVAEDLPAAEAIIAKYIMATGGAEAAADVKTMVLKGALKMPAFGMEGKMTTYKALGGKSLTTFDMGAMGTVKSGTKDGVAWEMNPMSGNGVKEGAEKASRLRSADMNIFKNWKTYFTEAKCVGEATVDGAACYKVVMTPKEGGAVNYAFNKETGLLVQQEEPGAMGKLIITLGDYKKVGKISLAHKVIIDFGQGTMENIIESIEINGEIPEGTFDLPAEIKATQK
jgi:hypothetical protein